MLTSPVDSHRRSPVVERVDPTQATIQFENPLTGSDIRELCGLARNLPSRVLVLRVELRASQADQYTMYALREVVRAWRARGTLQLVFSGESAASSERLGVGSSTQSIDPEWSSPAHTAAFL